ncbi:arabinosylfuranosidase ArfA [Zhihengliuella halotolerans]|uniref:arabinosylfuranosidase ArfA n=1 Tax=Zhihengliuella halotolerans TaxID=370736 RepID=UPI000C802DBE|nr:alpha-L-arabinofuranosidase C-terminal domain-containing protein [Zhihengliuella halotolerans]
MPSASITIDSNAAVAEIDRRIFGAFVEHLGRCVYDGIYEPGHEQADENGFRRDVTALVKELGATTIRYPGGNFVSGYRWEDGVGPREKRPVRRDLAWHSLENNQVGLNEFATWLKEVDSELMLAVNLGTRGILEALDLLEYTNHPSGTALSDLRAEHGYPEPWGVKMWCLGNEMDGPWQTGYMTADDYGKLAARTGQAMKAAEKDLELVICGSSGSAMPTFGEWERTVLEHAYEHVDYISCHAYYQERGGDLDSYLASAADMRYFIETVVATADHVKHRRKSDKTIMLSFDEWNIWYLDEHHESDEVNDEWRIAPRQLEDVYSVADAVVFGSLLMTLLENHDRVRSASLAQLVNVIAPIMTEPGGAAWRQTTFFPFSVTSRLARGRVLRPQVTTASVTSKVHGENAVVDCVATAGDENAAVFLFNRGREAVDVTIDVASLGRERIDEAVTLWDEDVYAKNTKDDPERVGLKPLDATLAEGQLTVRLEPVSWSALNLA